MADAAAREARRQRILKSGADRLAKISGVTAPSGAAAAVEDAPASVAAADQTEQAALAPSPITPVDIQAAILATAPLVAAEHFKQQQQQPQPPRIRRGTSSMSTSAALEENGLGGSTGSGGGGVQDTIVMTVLNTIAPERTAAKPSALAVATTGLPAWFTASQVLLVVALVLAQFGSVWQSLGDEPSVFKWIATFEHLLSGPTSLEFGLVRRSPE